MSSTLRAQNRDHLTIALAAAASVCAPNVMVPSTARETERFVWPKVRFSIVPAELVVVTDVLGLR